MITLSSGYRGSMHWLFGTLEPLDEEFDNLDAEGIASPDANDIALCESVAMHGNIELHPDAMRHDHDVEPLLGEGGGWDVGQGSALCEALMLGVDKKHKYGRPDQRAIIRRPRPGRALQVDGDLFLVLACDLHKLTREQRGFLREVKRDGDVVHLRMMGFNVEPPEVRSPRTHKRRKKRGPDARLKNGRW